jgi:hypothetical protein
MKVWERLLLYFSAGVSLIVVVGGITLFLTTRSCEVRDTSAAAFGSAEPSAPAADAAAASGASAGAAAEAGSATSAAGSESSGVRMKGLIPYDSSAAPASAPPVDTPSSSPGDSSPDNEGPPAGTPGIHK